MGADGIILLFWVTTLVTCLGLATFVALRQRPIVARLGLVSALGAALLYWAIVARMSFTILAQHWQFVLAAFAIVCAVPALIFGATFWRVGPGEKWLPIVIAGLVWLVLTIPFGIIAGCQLDPRCY